MRLVSGKAQRGWVRSSRSFPYCTSPQTEHFQGTAARTLHALNEPPSPSAQLPTWGSLRRNVLHASIYYVACIPVTCSGYGSYLAPLYIPWMPTQVFLSKSEPDAGAESGSGNGKAQRYTLLARSGNEVQEVEVLASLSREAMKSALSAALSGVIQYAN